MANSSQSAKRARQAERRRLRGQSLRSQFRTAAKKTRASAQTGDSEVARKNFRAFQTIADRLADRGVVPHNTVSRLKSRINAELKKAQERAMRAQEQAAQAAQAAEEQAVADTIGDAGAAQNKTKSPKPSARRAKSAAKQNEEKSDKPATDADADEVKAESPEPPETQKAENADEEKNAEVKKADSDSPDSTPTPPAAAQEKTDDDTGEKAQKAN